MTHDEKTEISGYEKLVAEAKALFWSNQNEESDRFYSPADAGEEACRNSGRSHAELYLIVVCGTRIQPITLAYDPNFIHHTWKECMFELYGNIIATELLQQDPDIVKEIRKHIA